MHLLDQVSLTDKDDTIPNQTAAAINKTTYNKIAIKCRGGFFLADGKSMFFLLYIVNRLHGTNDKFMEKMQRKEAKENFRFS